MTTINSILIEVGKKPAVYKLSAYIDKQIEEISALLGGNFTSSRLFEVGEGLSLHIFINDMAIPLQLPPNRRFPAPDQHEIIFGNALFLVLDDEKGDVEGPLDIPDTICNFFIEKLTENFKPCRGDEKPDPESEIFVENRGTEEERHFKWEEVERPEKDLKFIGKGYVRIVDDGVCDTFEIKGRYFKQIDLPQQDKPLQ
ncbi:hypothetical protein [Pelosinus sp. sgz500959]|uniref:DUF3846 domain-containing protein n=1 Tax=Pelosinus sp. sgz500959 TaxID=3242472 RepID=UPI00366BB1CA